MLGASRLSKLYDKAQSIERHDVRPPTVVHYQLVRPMGGTGAAGQPLQKPVTY